MRPIRTLLVCLALLVGACSGYEPESRREVPPQARSSQSADLDQPTHQVIRTIDLVNATIPSGACAGWPHAPIELNDGEGESRLADGSFGGASIVDATLIGYADFDRDDTLDALMAITCFGSTKDMCCAGRASILTYALPLTTTPSGGVVVLGSTIEGGPERRIETVRIRGRRVMTKEWVIYPESFTEAELGYPPNVSVLSTYSWTGSRWSRADEIGDERQ